MSRESALEHKLVREIASRKAAEELLEQKSFELYQANEQLKLVLNQLQKQNREDLNKLEFEQQIKESLLHFGRAFLSRTLDDGLVCSLLERLKSSFALSDASLFLIPNFATTIIATQFGAEHSSEIGMVKPYANWCENVLKIPLIVDNQIVGELCVTLVSDEIDKQFVISQMTLVVELLGSAISRQSIITSNQKARARAEESERATKEFVAMINHELRTPLNGLLGSAELLADTELDSEQLALLNNLTHSGGLLRHIINDILDFSKMSAGMMELVPAHFVWSDIRNMLIGVFEPRAREKGISFSLIDENPFPSVFWGDKERITQVLVNLVGNAIKFTHEGSVTLEVDWKNNYVSFRVRDTGIGIDEQALDMLFEPFVQVDRTAKRNYEGTGLGLAICKRLIDMMQGELTVASTKGVGSEFHVVLPLPAAKAECREVNPAAQRTKNKSLDSLNILVVDDIRLNHLIINQMLKKIGIVPDIAVNGVDAINAVINSNYDLVFMDCRMPEMDGFEATEHLRERQYGVPIIALTAGTTLEERDKCISSGMDDILIKPYTANDLQNMLEKWT